LGWALLVDFSEVHGIAASRRTTFSGRAKPHPHKGGKAVYQCRTTFEGSRKYIRGSILISARSTTGTSIIKF
jgi:hypothetical protein